MALTVRRALVTLLVCGCGCLPIVVIAAQTTQTQTPPVQAPPVPRPFPGSNPTTTTPAKPTPPQAQGKDKPATPATPPPLPQTAPAPATQTGPATSAPAPAGTPTEQTLGVKLFPGAEFLESFDAGRGQRLYLFGTNASFLDVVAFYKGELKGGTALFKEPAMQQFDIPGAKFQKELMAYPPSVVVKDYTWLGVTGDLKPGYVAVNGTTEKRFYTVVQIVPAPSR